MGRVHTKTCGLSIKLLWCGVGVLKRCIICVKCNWYSNCIICDILENQDSQHKEKILVSTEMNGKRNVVYTKSGIVLSH